MALKIRVADLRWRCFVEFSCGDAVSSLIFFCGVAVFRTPHVPHLNGLLRLEHFINWDDLFSRCTRSLLHTIVCLVTVTSPLCCCGLWKEGKHRFLLLFFKFSFRKSCEGRWRIIFSLSILQQCFSTRKTLNKTASALQKKKESNLLQE